MAKRIMIYLKDEDLEVLWDISWAKLVQLAIEWINAKWDLMKELNEIKSLVKWNSSWQKRDYVISDKSSPYNPVTQVTPVTIANHQVVQTWFWAKVKKSWTEKQEVLLQTAYTDIMSWVTQDWFKVGDDTTYVFERLYVWMTGDIREELKERVKKWLEEKANEIDYTLFIF